MNAVEPSFTRSRVAFAGIWPAALIAAAAIVTYGILSLAPLLHHQSPPERGSTLGPNISMGAPLMPSTQVASFAALQAAAPFAAEPDTTIVNPSTTAQYWVSDAYAPEGSASALEHSVYMYYPTAGVEVVESPLGADMTPASWANGMASVVQNGSGSMTTIDGFAAFENPGIDTVNGYNVVQVVTNVSAIELFGTSPVNQLVSAAASIVGEESPQSAG